MLKKPGTALSGSKGRNGPMLADLSQEKKEIICKNIQEASRSLPTITRPLMPPREKARVLERVEKIGDKKSGVHVEKK